MKVAVITGASSGIGWALAHELASRGVALGLIARRHDRLKELRAELEAKVPVAIAACDIQDRPATEKAIEQMSNQLTGIGPIDTLFANAGVGSTNPHGDLKIDEAETVIRTNLLGVMACINAVLPGMLERNAGRIVAISSLAAYKGLPTAAAYCASKSGVNAYMESLRIQYHRSGVRFTTVCPGFIRTPMIEKNQGMFGIIEAPEAARRIVGAVERGKKVYNFPWLTNRLTKITYWLPDWLVARTAPREVGGGK